MSDRHVVPADTGWQVEKADAKRPSATAPTQVEAVTRAVEIVANDGGGEVVVHATDGTVRETRAVEAGAEDTTAKAVGTAAAAAATGAKATTGKAARAVSGTAGAVTKDARSSAKKARTNARRTAGSTADTAAATTGAVADEAAAAANGRKRPGSAARDAASRTTAAAGEVGDDVSATGRQIAGDTRAAGRRAATEVDRAAAQAGTALVGGADRAAQVGAGVDTRLEDASHRAGRFIHSVTERAASPLDAASHALNPVRIAGRTAGVVIAGVLHVGAVVTGRGTRQAQRSAHELTARR